MIRALTIAMVCVVVTSCQKPKREEAVRDNAAQSSVSKGKNFEIETRGPAACNVNSECAALVHLKALGHFHINKEYPYRFLAKPAAGLRFVGKDASGPETFSKAAGDFLIDSEKEASLSVSFVPSAKGPAVVSGVYKMSVCTEEACEIQEAPLSIDVTVL